jgi:hypothetical protein
LTPFHVALGIFLFGTTVLLVRAFLRRGKNILETAEGLPGESTLAEREVELSALERRRPKHYTLAFLRARVRVTTARILVAQRGLFSDKHVLRHVIYLRPQDAPEPSAWKDGYSIFVLDAQRSRIETGDTTPTLHLLPTDDASYLPECVLLRGAAIEEVARLAGLAPQPSEDGGGAGSPRSTQ